MLSLTKIACTGLQAVILPQAQESNTN